MGSVILPRGVTLRRSWWYLAASILVVAPMGCSEPDTQPGGGPASWTVTLFLTDPVGVARDCAAVQPLTWEISAATEEGMAAEAVRRVIRDVTPSAALHPEGTRPLVEYYRGVRIDGDTVVVRFDGGSLAYLNNAACAQIAAKTPIVRTLVELTGASMILWEIDGEIFDAWDA